MLVGLVSDTHGVFDPQLHVAFAGVAHILHAGDVGHHGGAAAVLSALRQLAPVTAVAGNVDDDAEARALLPPTALVRLRGWDVLLVHVAASAEAAAAVKRHRPDVVLTGHSHQWSERVEQLDGGARRLHINPGSAGPARFKLPRSLALLHLPERGGDAWPTVQRIDLAPKAPPRLPEARRGAARSARPQRSTAAGVDRRRRAAVSASQSGRKRLKA